MNALVAAGVGERLVVNGFDELPATCELGCANHCQIRMSGEQNLKPTILSVALHHATDSRGLTWTAHPRGHARRACLGGGPNKDAPGCASEAGRGRPSSCS